MEFRLGTKTQITKKILGAILACLIIYSPVSASHGKHSQLGHSITSIVERHPSILTVYDIGISFGIGYGVGYGVGCLRKLVYNQKNKDKKAGNKTQTMAKEFFDTMRKSELPGPLGRFLTDFRKKTCNPPVVYKNSLTKFLNPNELGMFNFARGIHLRDEFINAIESESDSSKEKALGILHHEVVHAWQKSSFIRFLLNIIRIPFWGMTKYWYHDEYQADQKTVEQLYKMKKYKALEAQLESSFQRPHPYCYGTLDTYKKLLTTHPDDDTLSKIQKKIIAQQETIKLLNQKVIALVRDFPHDVTLQDLHHKKNKLINKLITELKQPQSSKGWKTRYREYLQSLSWMQWLLAPFGIILT